MNGLIADKVYGSKKLRELLVKLRRKCCIAMKSNAKVIIPHAPSLYKKRHRIENMFARIKDLKGLALRTNRCSNTFASFISLAFNCLFFNAYSH